MALAEHTEVEFFSFSALYPKALYPGSAQANTDESRQPHHPNLRIHRRLTWYNPLSWVSAGMQAKGEIINLQWWSVPLAPILIVIALIAYLRHIPVIVTVHNVTPHSGNRLIHKLASRMLYQLTTAVLLHSRHNEEVFKSIFPNVDAWTDVIPMGAADFQHHRPIDKPAARTRLQIAQHKKVLLLMGAIRKYKGWDVALQAMREIRNHDPNVILIIAGQAWDSTDRISAVVRDHRLEANVKLDLQFIPDSNIHYYLSAADILLMPYTHFDAQSGIGTSALSYNLPIIVSDCGGLQDLVIDDDSIVPRRDATMLAKRSIEILSNSELYETLCSHSAFLAQRYAWHSISKQICRIFQCSTQQQTR